jgi:hypothetical protein
MIAQLRLKMFLLSVGSTRGRSLGRRCRPHLTMILFHLHRTRLTSLLTRLPLPLVEQIIPTIAWTAPSRSNCFLKSLFSMSNFCLTMDFSFEHGPVCFPGKSSHTHIYGGIGTYVSYLKRKAYVATVGFSFNFRFPTTKSY